MRDRPEAHLAEEENVKSYENDMSGTADIAGCFSGVRHRCSDTLMKGMDYGKPEGETDVHRDKCWLCSGECGEDSATRDAASNEEELISFASYVLPVRRRDGQRSATGGRHATMGTAVPTNTALLMTQRSAGCDDLYASALLPRGASRWRRSNGFNEKCVLVTVT